MKEKFVPMPILVLACVVRILFALSYTIHIASDAIHYNMLANSIVAGNGFSLLGVPNSYRLPGYPFLLAAIYAVHHSESSVILIQILCDCLTCLLLYKIGFLINKTTGIVASVLWAIFPTAIIYTSLLFTETIFTTIFLTILYIIIQQDRWTIRFSTIIGFLTGLLTLIKPYVVLCVGVMIVWKWRNLPNHRRRLQVCALMFLIIFCIAASWALRNKNVIGSVTLTTNSGVNFWIGNNSKAHGGYYFEDGNEIDTISNEVRKNAVGYQKGIEFILKHPGHALALVPMKLAYMFTSKIIFILFSMVAPKKYHYMQLCIFIL